MTTKEITEMIEKVESGLIEKYPDSGLQVMNSFRSWLLDIIFANYISKNKTEFKKVLKIYGSEAAAMMDSEDYRDNILSMHENIFGEGVPEEDRAKHVNDAISICKESVNDLIKNMLLVAAGKEPFSEKPTKKIPKGCKLRDINGDEIVL